MPNHAVNKRCLDDTVNDLARDLTTENQRYTDNLILQSTENRSAEIQCLNFLINTETFQASNGEALQDLNMNEHTLSGISTPVENSDDVPKSYFDDFFVNGASNNISMNNFKITNFTLPVAGSDAAAANKEYVDRFFGTGIEQTLQMNNFRSFGLGAPINSRDAVNKKLQLNKHICDTQ